MTCRRSSNILVLIALLFVEERRSPMRILSTASLEMLSGLPSFSYQVALRQDDENLRRRIRPRLK
jgi:hypothetical protein